MDAATLGAQHTGVKVTSMDEQTKQLISDAIAQDDAARLDFEVWEAQKRQREQAEGLIYKTFETPHDVDDVRDGDYNFRGGSRGQRAAAPLSQQVVFTDEQLAAL